MFEQNSTQKLWKNAWKFNAAIKVDSCTIEWFMAHNLFAFVTSDKITEIVRLVIKWA